MDYIEQYIAELKQVLNHLPGDRIHEVISCLHQAQINGNQVFIMGNGGSAATASHFVCDLSKNTRINGKLFFRVIGLADNIPAMLAYANDEGYETIFARQLANLIKPHDVVIGISASGNSQNVINAIELANRSNAVTIGFTGFGGGKLGRLVQIHICVPGNCIEQVEDVHLVLEHLICKQLREQCGEAVCQ